MKNIMKYMILFAAMFLFSCSEWLDLVPPDGLVQDEYWKKKEDVTATLMGAYQKLATMDEILFLYGEVRGDMISRDNNTPAYIRNIMDGNIYPDNQLCNWSDFYEIITYCNFVLKYNNIVYELDPTYSEYRKLGTDSEALFLRSLAYFYLVRIFKEVPFVINPTESDNVELYPRQTADTVILKALKEDLIQARKYVSDDYGSLENNLGRAGKNAINALLADICLWNFEYEACIGYIEEIESSIITLMPGSQWFSIFYPGNSIEGIFEIQYDNNLDQTNTMFEVTYTEDKYEASQEAFNRFFGESSKEIIRGDGSLRVSDMKIWKYCGAASDGKTLRPGSDRKSANWIIYRYADVLLMKAEALSQSGQYEEALEYLNRIRSRALKDINSSAQNPEGLEDLIMEERAREFAFEGKRWFDLLRMGRRNNYARKNDLIEIIIQNVPSNQRLVLGSKLSNPYGWYLPVYNSEMERNKNLVQNPYYEGY